MTNDKVQSLKEEGNKCSKEGKYHEAMLHYTHAIKLDPSQYQLYSNRSLIFLKLQQYYYAHQDAKEVIKLNPSWAKGYYRKAQVEFEAGHYEEALDSYRLSLKYVQDSDSDIYLAIKKTKEHLKKQKENDNKVPWLGAVLGIVIGMSLVAFDNVANNTNPILSNLFLKVLLIILCAIGVFYLSNLQRSSIKSHRQNLLKPPLDLF